MYQVKPKTGSYPSMIKSDGYTNSVKFGMIKQYGTYDPFLTDELRARIKKTDPARYLRMNDSIGSSSR
jgi:hypothetical protein